MAIKPDKNEKRQTPKNLKYNIYTTIKQKLSVSIPAQKKKTYNSLL